MAFVHAGFLVFNVCFSLVSSGIRGDRASIPIDRIWVESTPLISLRFSLPRCGFMNCVLFVANVHRRDMTIRGRTLCSMRRLDEATSQLLCEENNCPYFLE